MTEPLVPIPRRPRFWAWQTLSLLLLGLFLLPSLGLLVLAIFNPWALVLIALFPAGLDALVGGSFFSDHDAAYLAALVLGLVLLLASLIAPVVLTRRAARAWDAGAHDAGLQRHRRARWALVGGLAALVVYWALSIAGGSYSPQPANPGPYYGSGQPGTGAAAR